MIKLRFSLLMALLVVAMSVLADNAPAKVQTALKKMYPKADGIALAAGRWLLLCRFYDEWL